MKLATLFILCLLCGCASESGRPAGAVAPRTLSTAGLPPLPVPSTNQIRLKSRAAPQPQAERVTPFIYPPGSYRFGDVERSLDLKNWATVVHNFYGLLPRTNDVRVTGGGTNGPKMFYRLRLHDVCEVW